MDDRIDDLMSEIAEFLHHEQEMYGSLPFPATGPKKSETALTNEGKTETKSGDSEPEKSEIAPVSDGTSRSKQIDKDSGKSDTPTDNEDVSKSKLIDKEPGISEPATVNRGKTETKSGDSEPEKSEIAPAIEDRSELKSEETKPRGSESLTGGTRLEQATSLEELKQICEEADDLKTDLANTNLVFGVGNPNADLMLIGEAPGEQEDKQSEPFVGAAGQLLNKILAAIQFERDDVYIANILKHRPPGNRNPNPDERLRSLPYLLKQIDLIQPKLILCLGRVSATTLLKKEDSLRNLRGQFYPYRNCLLTVTYHPAALLRNPQWKRPTWEDVQKVRAKYDELTNS